MNWKLFNSINLLLLVLIFLINYVTIEATVLSIPEKSRTQGKLKLLVPSNDQELSEHHLPFSESLDLGRNVISIGYTGVTPAKYLSKAGHPTLKVDSHGFCTKVNGTGSLIPELSWFIGLAFPEVDIAPLVGNVIGPTGLITIANALTKDSAAAKERNEVYRQVPCAVYSLIYEISPRYSIKMEFYVPGSGVSFNNVKKTYFSIQVTTFETKFRESIDHSYKTRFIIDYLNVDSFDGDSASRLEAFDKDFDYPLGCGEFLEKSKLNFPVNSFIMNYYQYSLFNYIQLAYDHANGYLRREIPNIEVNIWDLNEALLYHRHLDKLVHLQTNSSTEPRNLNECSVVKVADANLSPVYRPFEFSGSVLSVASFLGASSVSLMGHGEVREMPCLIYEAILDQPPMVFFTSEDHLIRKSSFKVDYIVQFYMLQSANNPGNTGAPSEKHKKYWPAKIQLYRRIVGKNLIEHVDEIQIFDFHSSLNGDQKKSVELFMASECFENSANNQLKVEMAIKIDRVHANTESNISRAFLNNERAKFLAENKFKLEYLLINDIINKFHISRMHLIEYEMKLERNHINLNMILGDRQDLKQLQYVGNGDLPMPNSYESSRYVMWGRNEESCILMSSLIAEISMIVYCPYNEQTNPITKCTAVYGENEPAIRNVINTDPMVPGCQVYRFRPIDQSNNRIGSTVWDREIMKRHTISLYDFEDEDPKVAFRGRVIDYDIEHEIKLEKLEDYLFSSEQPDDQPKHLVKMYKNFDYKTEGECAKMCQLDASCRSYSYCQIKNAKLLEQTNHFCAWSTMDLRNSQLKEQLIHMIPNEQKLVSIKGNGRDVYNLKLMENCDIYERNYLDMFRVTEETVALPATIKHQFQTARSAFDCAKLSVDLELNHLDHHVAMFAFCPREDICLLDEQLFKLTREAIQTSSVDIEEPGDNSQNVESESGDEEVSCRVYRKKYQTYFNVSSKVIKLTGDQAENQVLYEFKSVEECARACWNQLGQICASFDFCSPNQCYINQIDLIEAETTGQTEIRPSCLHYDRDLKWDDLHRDHSSIGRQRLYVKKATEGGDSSGHLGTFFAYALSLCAFFAGLFMGVRVNDKMEAVTIKRQSLSGQSGAGSQFRSPMQMFAFQSFPASGSYIPEDELDFSIDHQSSYVSASAIELDVLKKSV